MSVSRVGKTKNLITLQTADLSTDSMGGYTTARSTYVTAYAKMTPKGGKEIFSDNSIAPDQCLMNNNRGINVMQISIKFTSLSRFKRRNPRPSASC